jgi:hypothetical protein
LLVPVAASSPFTDQTEAHSNKLTANSAASHHQIFNLPTPNHPTVANAVAVHTSRAAIAILPK